ncbi:hypothetical protein ABK040_008172 [Willaertia magna]
MSGIFRWVMGVGGNENENNNDANNNDNNTSQNSTENVNNNSSLSAEEIRQRRLNRLTAMASSTTNNNNINVNKSTSPTSSSGTIKTTTRNDPMDTRDDFVTPSSTNTITSNTSPISIKKQTTSNTTTSGTSPTSMILSKTPPNTTITSSPPTINDSQLSEFEQTRKKLTIEERFIHDSICKIFKVTLIKSTSSISSSGGNYYLTELITELQNENHGLFLSEKYLESVLVERISNMEKDKSIFSYLIECYDRLEKEIQINEQKKKENNLKYLKTMKDIIISYSGIVLSEPEMFDQNENIIKQGGGIIVNYLIHENGLELPGSFLNELVNKFNNIEEDKTLEKIFRIVFTELSNRMLKITMLDDYSSILYAMKKLTLIKELGIILVNHPIFFPIKNDGYAYEYESILGPFFKMTVYYDHAQVGQHYFGLNIERLTNQDVSNIKSQLRSRITSIHNDLHKIIMDLLKPKETRDKMVDWLSKCVQVNQSRAKMHVDPYTSSSEGFMTNFCSVMLRLCSPFLAIDNNKLPITKIQSSYILQDVNFKLDTKLKLSEKEFEEYSKTIIPLKEYSFITKTFFLTYRSLHLGLLQTIDKYQNALKRLGELQRVYSVQPSDQLRKEIDQLYIVKWTAETHLLHPELHKYLLDFYRFSTIWLIELVDPNNNSKYPTQSLNLLNLNEEGNKEFGSMSEFFIENIIDFILFLLRFKPESLDTITLDEVFDMMCLFLYHSNYIKNPYIIAKYPEVYAAMIPQGNNDTLSQRLAEYIPNHKLSQNYLTSGLMRLYIDIEHTGTSTSFYDKFTPRYYISLVLKNLWKYKAYRESFLNITKQRDANTRFMKFFNVLLNDSIYLLDNSLKDLQKIREVQNLMENIEEWNKLTNQQRTEKNKDLAQYERIVKSYLLLANETVHMLSYLSKDIPHPFLRPEMVDRVASMLNYFLVELAGPQCQNLKVKEPEKYHFNPKYLLTEITDTYIHFSGFDEFTKAVAKDERSFKSEVFERVIAILRRIGKPEEYIKKFDTFALKAVEESKKLMEEDVDFSEVPDEFLDPITYTIMEDPVLLPASKIHIDRATIERHLLNDANDPFNRSHLTVEMLIPAPELKQKIVEWKKSKRRKQE